MVGVGLGSGPSALTLDSGFRWLKKTLWSKDMTVTFRTVTSRVDKEQVFRLRYEIYVEDQNVFLDEADHQNRFLYDEFDQNSTILVAEDKGQLVGTLRLTMGWQHHFNDAAQIEYQMGLFSDHLDQSQIAITTRLVVRKEYRGTDVGLQLCLRTFALAADHNIELILAKCEPHLVLRNQEYGFRAYGQLFNSRFNGVLVPIAILCGDLDYLAEINSPMFSVFSRRTAGDATARNLVRIMRRDPCAINAANLGPETYHVKALATLKNLAAINQDFEPIAHSPKASKLLLHKSQILNCRHGQSLILKDHIARTLYILLEGELLVQTGGLHQTRITQSGALVGEVAFFTGGRRTRDVVVGPKGARVLALNGSAIRQLLQGSPAQALPLLNLISRQLRTRVVWSDQPGLDQELLETTDRAVALITSNILQMCDSLLTQQTLNSQAQDQFQEVA